MPALSRLLVTACCIFTALGGPAPPPPGSPKPGPPGPKGSDCKCLPGDKCWPKIEEWNKLNRTTKGKLTATVPLASVCHDPNYNAAECAKLKKVWKRPETHVGQPESFFAPYFQNGTCDPFGPQTAACTLGNYASYSIRVSGPEEVIAAFDFAKKHNVRLSIKNTGHDFLGKSSGKGSIVLWTHNLKDSVFLPAYKGSTYTGPAVKLGAGVSTAEGYLFAKQHGVRVAGSSCASVGMAGGFTAGGGHNPLMGHHGMAADNTLEWEVVTPEGQHVVARPDGPHRDLFWAMSGGGAGVWGVALSVTVRAHADGPIGGGSMTIPAAGLAPDAFWDAVHAFYSTVPQVLDTGAYVTALLTRDALVVAAVTAPNKTGDQVAALFAPFRTYLADHGVPHTQNWTAYDNFYDHMANYFGPYPFGAFEVSQLTGGRLAPKAAWEGPDGPRQLVNGLRRITATGRWYFGMNFFDLTATATARAAARPDRQAVMPAWRDARVHLVMVGDWDYAVGLDEMRARHAEQAGVMLPLLREAAGGRRGIYLNEGNFAEPDWQNEFYGPNYPRLSQVKRDYDPHGLLYARTAVGSERWAPDAEGRLCPVGK